MGFEQDSKPYYKEGEKIRLCEDISIDERKKIGTIAKSKNCDWFKRIDLGEKVGEILFSKYDEIDGTAGLKVTFEQLKRWVMDNEA